jgi:hypothetical protein
MLNGERKIGTAWKMRGGWFEAARCGVVALALMAAEAAFAKSYILVAGRRDPRIYAIDFEAALRPENNATPNAIVSRSIILLLLFRTTSRPGQQNSRHRGRPYGYHPAPRSRCPATASCT